MSHLIHRAHRLTVAPRIVGIKELKHPQDSGDLQTQDGSFAHVMLPLTI